MHLGICRERERRKKKKNPDFEKHPTLLTASTFSLHLNLKKRNEKKKKKYENNRAVNCDPTTYMKYATATIEMRQQRKRR